MAESPQEIQERLERDIARFAEENLIGRAYGATNVVAGAEYVWRCNFPLEPEPEPGELYPGLEVRTKPPLEDWGEVVARPDSEGRVPIRLYHRVEVEVRDVEEIEPMGPMRERHRCSWTRPHPYGPWPHPLNWLRFKLFGHPGRCPLHGKRMEQIIELTTTATLPITQTVHRVVVR